MRVAMNNFARRQTADSGYSHYEGGFEALCTLVEHYLDNKVVLSNEDGAQVIRVVLPGDGFMAAVTQAQTGMEFSTLFDSRTPDEYPYFSFRAKGGDKVPAIEADIILYNNRKLAIKAENSTNAEWEIVSINAKRDTSEEPPHPVTMMRNQKNYPGGTKTSYTPEQWADSIEYWYGGGPTPPYVMLDCGSG